ncbi:MAG: DUF2779 domain-containing protein [Candidatus Competibacteraceae bacterium]|nr:DUF2779 domain-containing protein [Candidatus Competibacteraceae bacterium]
MNTGLSKSRLMDWRQCPRKLWLKTHRPELIDYDTDTETRFRIGFDVGERARALYPTGLLIDEPDLTAALKQTQTALREYPNRPLFEATLAHQGVLVRVDLLLPETRGTYRLIEVKASTGVKAQHIEDAAIQAWVTQSTVALSEVALAHINNQFVYAGDNDYSDLFTITPISDAIAPWLPEVPDWIAQARAILSADEPHIAPGEQCDTPYPCPFKAHCAEASTTTAYPLNHLPRLSGWRRAGLEQLGISDIRDIPDDYPLTDLQQRITNVIRGGQIEHQPKVARIVNALPFPRYFLDFETSQCAVPIWTGTRPYQQLPVQWSCHIELFPGTTVPQHFLLDKQADPMRAFAESLILAVREPCDITLPSNTQSRRMDAIFAVLDYPEAPHKGPILVYNAAFEKRILAELAQALPDLAPTLEGISQRIIDLLPIVREHYYHPEMKGSWSLKSVLPTMAPHLSYEALGIGAGGEASSAWQELLHPQTTPDRCEQLRDALIDYCGLDTWAMLEMVRFLSKPSEQTETLHTANH